MKKILFLMTNLMCFSLLAFSQKSDDQIFVDSVKMEFDAMVKKYIDENNGHWKIDIIQKEHVEWKKRGFWFFTSWKKIYYPEILGPEHKKLLYEAKPDSFKEYVSDDQARYLIEVINYQRKDSATYNLWTYMSHWQYARLDSVPDSALSEPRKNYMKSEILHWSSLRRDKYGKITESPKEVALGAMEGFLHSPKHKAILDHAGARFGTGVRLIPSAEYAKVNNTDYGTYGEDDPAYPKQWISKEKADGRSIGIFIICNF
jgi:hypothetical protein